MARHSVSWHKADMPLHLEPIIDGAADAHTLFFIQGWPDDASLWDSAVGALRDRYRCVRLNMPGAAGTPSDRRGYTTDQIVEALARCVREVSNGAPVTLVIHDWGAYWGYILHHRHPELVERVAGLDVAPHVKPGPAAAAAVAAYQGWLAGAFLIGGPLGNWMTRSLASALSAPGRREGIRATMNYPYRNMWSDLFGGRVQRNTRGYWPEVPLLFVYGKKKPFGFHSQRWLDHVERVGGKVVALDVGHWVQLHPQFNEILSRWLDETQRKPA